MGTLIGGCHTCTDQLTHKITPLQWCPIMEGCCTWDRHLKTVNNILCPFSWMQGISECCVGGNVVDWFHWDPAKFWSCGHQRRIISFRRGLLPWPAGSGLHSERHYLLKWDVEKEVSCIVNKAERETLFGDRDGEKSPSSTHVSPPPPYPTLPEPILFSLLSLLAGSEEFL